MNQNRMRIVSESDAAALHGIIAGSSVITVVSHTHPDGDAVGSCLAFRSFLRQQGKDAEVVLPDSPGEVLMFLEGAETMTIASENREKAAERFSSSDLLVCLDFNKADRTGCLEEEVNSFRGHKVMIDHHLSPDRESFGLVISRCGISSTAELLYWVLMALPETCGDASRLPHDAAEALMTGMTTDTNNFANSVYPSTLMMASDLLEAGVDRDRIISMIFNRHRENRLRAMGWLLKDEMTITENGVAYMILTSDTVRRFGLKDGDTEGFVNLPLAIGKVRMSILVKADGDRGFRISIRSKEGTSANSCAKTYFNGGGHELAAGGRLRCPEDIPATDRVSAAAYIEKVTAEFFR